MTSQCDRRARLASSLTVALIARDEALMLPSFFDALPWAAHIILYDDGSKDSTAAIARERGARVFERVEGLQSFSEKRNYLHGHATTDWILWLDADERFPEELFDEVVALIAARPNLTAIRFRMQNYFLGRRMYGLAWNRWHGVRLARTTRSRWRDPIHERLVAEGEIEEARCPIIHLGDQSYAERAVKSLHYNRLEVSRLKRRPGFVEILLRPLAEFCRYYLLQYGFVDGRAGLIFALHVYAAWFQRLAMAYSEPDPNEGRRKSARTQHGAPLSVAPRPSSPGLRD